MRNLMKAGTKANFASWGLSLVLAALWWSRGVLLARTPGDERWDYRFAVPGVTAVDGIVSAMAFDTHGTFIFGGAFSSVGQVRAATLACLEGGEVRGFPDGPRHEPPTLGVTGLCFWNGDLFASGYFTNRTDGQQWRLARWNGDAWSSVAGVTAGIVNALNSDAQGLLVAGRFGLPGWTNPVALARWIRRPRLQLGIERATDGPGWWLSATGDPGQRYVVESSEDLRRWEVFGSGQGGASRWRLSGTDTAPARFYRAALVP